MAVTNLYPNLPGHLVEFKDGGLQLTSTDTQTDSGRSLLILGTAFDGPINEPVRIDATTVSQLFGSEVNENGYPNGATLTKYAKQAFRNGFSDVRCMRVTGSLAYNTVEKTVVSSETEHAASESGTIAGNSEILNGYSLTHAPVFPKSVVVTTAQNTNVSISTIEMYQPVIKIGANIISKKAPLNVTYDYYDISEKQTLTNQAAGNSATAFTPISLGLQDGEVIYKTLYTDEGVCLDKTDNLPKTKGVVVKNGDTTLEEGTDYDITNGEIVFKDNTDKVTYSDTVDVEFYKYTVKSVSDETFYFEDVDQEVTLPHVPKEGSITVSIDGTAVAATQYVVNGSTVKLTAGNFTKDASCVISYTWIETVTASESMIVRSIYGGSIYKTAKLSISVHEESGRKFLFTKPASKVYSDSDLPFYFTSVECPTVGELKTALMNYSLNNVFEIVCDDDEMSTADFPIGDWILSEGGEDGVVVTNNEMFEALSGKRDDNGYLTEQGAYQILENYNVDYIYPAGVYADAKQTVNTTSDFHNELALLCAVLTYRTKMTHGFIDVKPNSNTTLVGIQKYVEKLLEYNNDHFMRDAEGNDIVDTEGNKMDIGWYTSIVVGPEPVMLSDTLGTYYGSPAIAYAALNASIRPESAPTNKALPGVNGMKFKFSNKQMNELVGNRMVVFKLKNEGTTTASSTPYVVDGCTAGAASSDYTRLSTVKVVTDVVDQIREVADPFIGEPNTVEQRNALSALISKRLSYLMEQGEIQYYEFEINATIQQVVLGECSIALTLVAPMELRKITTVVALRAAA